MVQKGQIAKSQQRRWHKLWWREICQETLWLKQRTEPYNSKRATATMQKIFSITYNTSTLQDLYVLYLAVHTVLTSVIDHATSTDCGNVWSWESGSTDLNKGYWFAWLETGAFNIIFTETLCVTTGINNTATSGTIKRDTLYWLRKNKPGRIQEILQQPAKSPENCI